MGKLMAENRSDAAAARANDAAMIRIIEWSQVFFMA